MRARSRPRMRVDRPSAALAFAAACLLAAPAAWADTIALLPSRGGPDPAARTSLDGDLARGLAALEHTVINAAPAVVGVADGVADTAEEYRAVGAATRADWVLVGTVDPAITSERVELVACLVSAGRVESVAREVHGDRAASEVKEMLAVLVRPEGIGVGELPWERARAGKPAEAPKPPPAPPPKAPPPVPTAPPIEGRVALTYPTGAAEVWPAYSGGRRGFVGALVGASLPVARPFAATGSGASFVGGLRAGYAIGDSGLEPFVDLGGNLFGPRALWIDGGARWMWSPTAARGPDGLLRGAPFFLGPAVTAGVLVQLGASSPPRSDGTAYSSPAEAHLALGASLDLVYALAPGLQLEASLGDLRWVPTREGSILLLGATVGGALRF
jgi:hypothetical protein